MYLTAVQLARLRTRPHRTRPWLAIYKPEVVFSAQINEAAIAKGERTITVTSVSGDSNIAVAGMTVFIGTTSGGKEIGRVRLRTASATEIKVAENSIAWVNGWYLTVVRYFEAWGVFPRITLDANNIPSFFKDYDVAYTDQNEDMEPVVCMGPNHAGFLGPAPTGTHLVWYTASGTFDPTFGGSISSYSWHFIGGDPTGSTSADPGYIAYTGSGNLLTSLLVTTGDSATFTGQRHVMILDHPEGDGLNRATLAWTLDELRGSRDSGGYTARITVREDVDWEVVVEGALVVIFTEDWEGYTETKVGANAENRDSIFFTGYIMKDSITVDPVTNMIGFEVGGLAEKMKELSTFSATLETVRKAITWNQLKRLSVDRGVIHFLRWHSTVLTIADFSRTGDSREVQYIDFERGQIYDDVNSLLYGTVFASMVSDRQGKLWCETDANMTPTGTSRQVDTHMQSVIEITRQDWRDNLLIDRRPDAELSYIELGGIGYSGLVTGTSGALLSGAPGVAPDYYGSTQRLTGLVLTNQDQLNTLSGNAFAAANAMYPELEIPMAGDYRFLDIAPQNRVNLTLAASDNHRRIVMNSKPFIPQGIEYTWHAKDQVLLMNVMLREETSGPPGDTIIIPVDPPYDEPYHPWLELPQIVLPPLPIPPVPTPPPATGEAVYMVMNGSLVRTRDIWEELPTWELVPWSPIISGSVTAFYLDPADPFNAAVMMTNWTDGSSSINGPRMFRTVNLNDASPTWVSILDVTTMTTLYGGNYQRNMADFAFFEKVPGKIITLGRPTALDPFAVVLRTTVAYGGDTTDWETTDGNVIRNSGSLDHQACIEASSHVEAWGNVGTCWVTNGVNNIGACVSRNGGASWREGLVKRKFFDLTMCPFNNPEDEFAIASAYDGAGKNTYFLRDFGDDVPGRTFIVCYDPTGTDIYATANQWAPRRQGPTQMGRSLWAHPIDGYLYALIHNKVAEPNDRKTIFARRFIGGGYDDGACDEAWQIRGIWPFSAGNHLGPLAIHKSDPDFMYMGGNNNGEFPGYILASENGGHAWFNKDGNIGDIITPARPLTIQPNWTI